MSKIVITIEGGVLQDICTDGIEVDEIVVFEHDEHRLLIQGVRSDPDFLKKREVELLDGVIASNDELSVVSGYNGYYLYYGEKSACMGDGVDLFEGVSAGTLEFQICMQEWLNTGYKELIEAYFPNQE